MASNNPALSRVPAFRAGGVPKPVDAAALGSSPTLEELFNARSAGAAETGRMTYEDTVLKTVALFAVLLAAGAVSWFFPVLALPGAIVGLVLGLVNSFKRTPSAPLIIAYAAAEGLFLGGVSSIFEQFWGGVVVQAVVATLAVFGVMLALFASGKVRASGRVTKIFLVAMIGYLVYSLVNVGLMMFGGVSSDLAFGLNSMTFMGVPIGLIVGILAVLMGAYSLVLDFEFIKNGVQRRVDRRYGWQGAFGLMVTIVWLYVEFLRLFAILQRN
ncbi:Bax inhibitor-1/YccA family protein [Gryllotalpicola ginsengisoli]|uniref:Bax inhibitor-1/YccA family protein n=1 Tax=Gryllotalpicola ginsengisoli TaxID=444608 RepID=UPI0003B65553|nr:Bax inhibitor-1/YccA family protein [Gryllotalpicola ginsengisoli]